MSENKIEALRIILIKTNNENVRRQAIACMQAIKNDSPVIQTRYNQVVQIAMYSDTDWTPEEKELIFGELDIEDNRKSKVLIVRLSEAEHATVIAKASEEGMTISDYVRSKI